MFQEVLGYIKDMSKIFKLFFLALLLVLGSSNNAIVTYHLYTKYDKLTTVSCSDGANGLMSWGYKDLSLMFPYVTAWQPASWNSPQCGSCAKITWNGRFTYVTVVDQCGVINSAYSHFDMSKQAFTGLFGQEGIAKGTMLANFTIVASKYCPGNRKGVLMAPSPFKQNLPNQKVAYEQELQQNPEQQSQFVNPLWVRKSSSTQNLKSEQEQGNRAQDNANPSWVRGVESGDSDRTLWGGYSYDKQNERNEMRGNDNF